MSNFTYGFIDGDFNLGKVIFVEYIGGINNIRRTESLFVSDIVESRRRILNNFTVLFDGQYQTIIKQGDNYALIEFEYPRNSFTIISTSNLIVDEIRKLVSDLIDDKNVIGVRVYYKYNNNLDWTMIWIKSSDLNIDPKLFKLAGVDADKLAEEFLNSHETILLLFGEPGTGKSKLSLYLFKKFCELSPSFKRAKLIKGLPVLELLISNPLELIESSNDNRYLIYFDDIDLPSLKRDTENANSLVTQFISLLLSATDGVLPQYNKFIITTNLKIHEIDDALLRPGRLFAAINLKPIPYEALKDYNEDIAKLCKEKYPNKSEYTIAEITDLINEKQKNINYGFITRDAVLYEKRVTGF